MATISEISKQTKSFEYEKEVIEVEISMYEIDSEYKVFVELSFNNLETPSLSRNYQERYCYKRIASARKKMEALVSEYINKETW